MCDAVSQMVVGAERRHYSTGSRGEISTVLSFSDLVCLHSAFREQHPERGHFKDDFPSSAIKIIKDRIGRDGVVVTCSS